MVAAKTVLQENAQFLNEFAVKGIAYEDLNPTAHHSFFIKHSKLNRSFREGFWFFASERFFFLEELMKQQNLSKVVHLESDVMIYVDIEKLMPVLCNYYKGIGATFDTDTRCIPGFVFFNSVNSIEKLTRHMATCVQENLDDMYIMGDFRKKYGLNWIDTLPIVDEEYILKEKVKSVTPQIFCNHVNQFKGVFDAAYLGQFLGGIDPRNGDVKFGYVNPHCLINSSKMSIDWERDHEERLVPILIYKNKKRRIYNLHVHSKRLEKFYSIR